MTFKIPLLCQIFFVFLHMFVFRDLLLHLFQLFQYSNFSFQIDDNNHIPIFLHPNMNPIPIIFIFDVSKYDYEKEKIQKNEQKYKKTI
jgi:hypothetical protein